MRTRIKICGIVRPQDARDAAECGADAYGMIFYDQSASFILPEDAEAIVRAAPPLVSAVALFVNAETSLVREVIKRAHPALLQFHGDEEAEYCLSFGMPYIKACRVGNSEDITQTMRAHPQAGGFLLDSKTDGKYGGSGRKFDWSCIPKSPAAPMIVAGGLTPETVGELVRQHRPWGVDVSGGVAADHDRRRKEYDKISAFIKETRDADRQMNTS